MIHPYAHEDGGLQLADNDGIFVSAFKDIFKQVSSQIARGEIHDISKNRMPAYSHHILSHLGCQANDITNLRYLKKAALTADPIERMKHVLTFYISNLFISPTLTQCRIPLVPIVGETLQREMPTGERLYCE